MTTPYAPPLPPAQGDSVVATIIPYKNPSALGAYYCGVFSLIPVLGLILGPLALFFGFRGFRYVKANPTAKGTGHAIAGIVLGAIASLLNYGFVIFVLVMSLLR